MNQSVSPSKSSSPQPSPGSWDVDRGRSRTRRPSMPQSEQTGSRRYKGYHALLSSFGKVFHVEKRWKLIREMGSGAYGVVISAADEISGETVAIKLVTHVFDKIALAKRALREVTLLRHLSNHENITGLIDVDALTNDFNEFYIFMEPMEADLHQIIKSGQHLTNEHVQYFLYQVLRGMKYVHSAGVIHRDLKPGNLLVNADCELKICDFGLARGFEAVVDDENAPLLTEYVATRWYRAPEIMLAYRKYNTAIDVWSIGCILGELLLGKPLFKGKDYVDQLNKVLDVLGTPDEDVIRRIASDKAQAYIRTLSFKRSVPLRKIIPTADTQALDLLSKMLTFDPKSRITVAEALEHPWLATYHDIEDEPECPIPFTRWHDIEKLETIEEFREALWDEICDYRREARGLSPVTRRRDESAKASQPPPAPQETEIPKETSVERPQSKLLVHKEEPIEGLPVDSAIAMHNYGLPETANATTATGAVVTKSKSQSPTMERINRESNASATTSISRTTSNTPATAAPTDPVVSYARRSSILSARRDSTFGGTTQHQALPSFSEGKEYDFSAFSPVIMQRTTSINNVGATAAGGVAAANAVAGTGSVAFPSAMTASGFIYPARSRTASVVGVDMPRRMLRTLSTVSIHDGGAESQAIQKYLAERLQTEADAPPSEVPKSFGMDDEDDDEETKVASEKEDGKKKFRID